MIFFLAIVNCNSNGKKTTSNQDYLKNPNLEKATLAGGCFWCVESDFEKVDGVIEAVSGYTGGKEANPTYKTVSAGKSTHIESVEVYYDPKKITYSQILDVFWRHMDPTDPGGQFVDRGHQYTTAIFYHNDKQKIVAERSREKLMKSGRYKKPIVTKIIKAARFYKAEEYHQDYYKKSPGQYHSYRYRSGRDQYLKKVWGAKS